MDKQFIKFYMEYKTNSITSYQMIDWILDTFGMDCALEEVRDSRGFLQGFEVTVEYKDDYS